MTSLQVHSGICAQFPQFSHEDNHFEELFYAEPLLAETSTMMVSPPHSSGTALLGKLLPYSIRPCFGLIDLVDCNDNRHSCGLGVV
jgi:hypothetical protein